MTEKILMHLGLDADYVGGLGLEDAERLRESVLLAYLDGEVDGPRSYAATAWVVRGTVP